MAEGLLGKIGGGIKGLLGNPTVQGIGGAAAFGANPLLGLLAAPGIKNSRDRRSLENDVLREKLASIRQQRGAADELQGLLSDQTTIQQPDLQTGLLNVEGGASPLTIPGRRQSVPTASTPQGQQQMMALLAQLDPGAVASSLLPSTRSNPLQNKIDAFERSAGRRATESELQHMAGATSDTDLESRMAGIELSLLERKLNNEADDRNRETLERQVAEKTVESSAFRSLVQLEEMAGLNEVIANSQVVNNPLIMAAFGQAGVQGAVSAAKIAGMDVETVQRELNALQRFDQLGTQLAVTRLTGDAEQLSSSDTKFRTFRDTKPNSKLSAATNGLTIADTIEEMLEFFDDNNLTVDDREKWESLASSTRNLFSGQFVPDAESNGPAPPPGFERVP